MKKTTSKKNITIIPPTAADRLALRILVRARDDFQSQRKRMDNRIGRKAKIGPGGKRENQNIEERHFRPDDLGDFVSIADAARSQEEAIEKRLKQLLKRFPIWNEWLSTVKGCGTVSAAYIISEFDIHKATTVSKLWQYAGLNPSTVLGKKMVDPDKYKPAMGERIRTMPNDKVLVQTNEPIRGDRLTTGFVSPYNARLRIALCGVMADCFIKAQNSYAMEHYYPYKERLAHSDQMTTERVKGKPDKQIPWKKASDGHRHRAAIRKMIKMFLMDLYAVWRKLEGLEVRVPYQEQYLGHKHAA